MDSMEEMIVMALDGFEKVWKNLEKSFFFIDLKGNRVSALSFISRTINP